MYNYTDRRDNVDNKKYAKFNQCMRISETRMEFPYGKVRHGFIMSKKGIDLCSGNESLSVSSPGLGGSL